MIDSYKGLELLAPGEKSKNSDVFDHYLIVWQHNFDPSPANATLQDSLQQLVNYFWNYQILQVLILVLMPDPQDTPQLYTYIIFAPGVCRKPVLKALPFNYFENSPNAQFYYPVLSNWHRCPLIVSTWNFAPYVMLSDDKPPDGIEWKILEDMSKHFNATIIVDTQEKAFGNVFDNGTKTGAARLLHEKLVDVAVCSLARNVTHLQHFTSSIYYMQTTVEAYIMPLWEGRYAFELLVEPFQWRVWLFLFISILSSMVLMRPLTGLAYFQRIYMIILGTPTQFPRYWNLRFILMLFSIIMLVLRSCYLGTMFKIFSHPQQVLVRNLEDLIRYKYTLVLSPRFFNAMREIPTLRDQRLPLFIDNSSNLSSFNMIESHPYKRYVTLSSPVLQKYDYTQMKRQPKFVVLEGSHRTHQNTMYYSKHSFVRRFFDGYISTFRDMGMLENFRTKWMDNVFSPKLIKMPLENREARPIILEQFIGIFQALGVIWLCALIIFIIELLFSRNVNQTIE